MPGSSLRKILIAVGLLGLGLLTLVVLVVWRTGVPSIVSEQNAGRFDRPLFEAIVAQVRQAGLKPGTQQEFILEPLSDPKSLHPRGEDEASKWPARKGADRVWAQVSAKGELKVVIETRNLGHAGAYGFAYSDTTLSPAPMDGEGNWYRIDVPGHLYIVVPKMKIDGHWWEVLNNLD